jgi:C1A family cysteine protease
MTHKTGWIPDVPDLRDVSAELLMTATTQEAYPTEFDMRDGFSPVEDQKNLGSCTAQAGVAAVEFLLKQKNKFKDLSRLFLYKATRNRMGLVGDTGASIRETFKAMNINGICEEKLWPYVTSTFDNTPNSLMVFDASNHQAFKYYRCENLGHVKWCLLNKMPVVIGFPVYDHSFNPGPTGRIELIPAASVRGGHAICLVGFSDSKRCAYFKNSWGTSWGNKGYGELSYDYFTNKLASDMWAVGDIEA